MSSICSPLAASPPSPRFTRGMINFQALPVSGTRGFRMHRHCRRPSRMLSPPLAAPTVACFTRRVRRMRVLRQRHRRRPLCPPRPRRHRILCRRRVLRLVLCASPVLRILPSQEGLLLVQEGPLHRQSHHRISAPSVIPASMARNGQHLPSPPASTVAPNDRRSLALPHSRTLKPHGQHLIRHLRS